MVFGIIKRRSGRLRMTETPLVMNKNTKGAGPWKAAPWFLNSI